MQMRTEFFSFSSSLFVPLSAPMAKSCALGDDIDQDQTAQYMQPDLDLCSPLVETDLCNKNLSGTQQVIFVLAKRGRVYISGAERVIRFISQCRQKGEHIW